MKTKFRKSTFAWLFVAILLLTLTIGCGGGSSPSSGSGGQPVGATLDTLYTYDELNRLTSVSYGDGKVVSYTYDAAGNILTVERVR
jgi:YD repeat-containing protein